MRSAYCFELLIARVRAMERTRDILVATDNALAESQKVSKVDKSGPAVVIKAMNVQVDKKVENVECGFCAQTPGANSNHWALGRMCSSAFMSPEAIEKVIIALGMCSVCLFKHDASVKCKETTTAESQ